MPTSISKEAYSQTSFTNQTTEVISIPLESALSVEIRYALLEARDQFDPTAWTSLSLSPSSANANNYEIDLARYGLADGAYEYEFVVNGQTEKPVADPFAEEITRFGGYRGVFRIKNQKRVPLPFSWNDEFTENACLPENHELIIYEMPLRWMSTPPGETAQLRQVGLGTFDKVIFEHLNQLQDLGINAIELLPIQDSADTLNWGYGTRFFFAPDIDMGQPVDLKLLIKQCHQRGIRVILDIVMNHARDCPLEHLAENKFFLNSREEEPGRGEDYGARLFKYRDPSSDGRFHAREFHFAMADFWIQNYHIDGFRIDEFRGIDNWDFIQTFTEKAHNTNSTLFPGKPFFVIAEDSWRRSQIVKNQSTNPNGKKVVDSMWNFSFRDELRRLLTNELNTQWGEPSRSERIQASIAGWSTWDDYRKQFSTGFEDMAQAINYITSHDVEAIHEQRFFNYCFSHILREKNLSDGNVNAVRYFVDNLENQTEVIKLAHQDALNRVKSAYTLLCTSVGIPMLLADEEFADCHDLDHSDWRLKMSDPINWHRQSQVGRDKLKEQIKELITLRRSHSALKRNEITFFYFHPQINENQGARVFAFCRTNNLSLGSKGQVIVVANCGNEGFPEFHLPWFWSDDTNTSEHALPKDTQPFSVNSQEGFANIPLNAFQCRVFST